MKFEKIGKFVKKNKEKIILTAAVGAAVTNALSGQNSEHATPIIDKDNPENVRIVPATNYNPNSVEIDFNSPSKVGKIGEQEAPFLNPVYNVKKMPGESNTDAFRRESYERMKDINKKIQRLQKELEDAKKNLEIDLNDKTITPEDLQRDQDTINKIEQEIRDAQEELGMKYISA